MIARLLPSFTKNQHERLLRLFGVGVRVRSPDGYECTTEGTSKRTILLIHHAGSVRCSGFVWVTHDESTPSPFILPNAAERPLSDLVTLIEKNQSAVGLSPEVKSVRTNRNVEQRLLWQVCDNVVNHNKTPRVYIEQALTLFLKGNPTLPTNLCLLNIVDPGWRQVSKGVYARKDAFQTGFMHHLVAKRNGTLKRGELFFEESVFPAPFYRHMLSVYFTRLCGPELHEYVRALYNGDMPIISDFDNEIMLVLGRFGNKRKELEEQLHLGRGTFESAPACIKRVPSIEMKDMIRFNTAVVVAEVARERMVDYKSIFDPMLLEIIKKRLNECRISEFKYRVSSAVKNREVDVIKCWMRGYDSQRGIRCPFNSVQECLDSRTGGERLDPDSVTIPQVWVYTDPRKKDGAGDHASGK